MTLESAMPGNEAPPSAKCGAASPESVEQGSTDSTVRADGHARSFDPLERDRVNSVVPANPPAPMVAEPAGPGEKRYA
jgi:hypothetical protein